MIVSKTLIDLFRVGFYDEINKTTKENFDSHILKSAYTEGRIYALNAENSTSLTLTDDEIQKILENK